jgi:hypothetical protein
MLTSRFIGLNSRKARRAVGNHWLPELDPKVRLYTDESHLLDLGADGAVLFSNVGGSSLVRWDKHGMWRSRQRN